MPHSASEWMVALNEAPNDQALRRAHERWLAASEGNRRDWNETLRLWQMMSMTLPAHADEWGRPARAQATATSETLAQARSSQPSPPQIGGRGQQRGVRLRRRLPAAAGIALAACLAVVLLPDLILTLQADFTSATGEIKTVDLEDGSRIRLAPESAVALAFEPSARRVELLGGEAFFEVAADQNRPFRVRAGAAETVVLGTRFGVGLSQAGTTVAVEEGSVRVTHSPDGASGSTLSVGDVLLMDPDGTSTTGKSAPSLIAAWRKGKLVAQNQPLAELVAVLDRYFDGWIIVADPSLAKQSLTGIYRLSDPKAALRAMAQTQGATVREISPWVLVLSRQ